MNDVIERPDTLAMSVPISKGVIQEKLPALLDVDPEDLLWHLLTETARWALKERRKQKRDGYGQASYDPTIVAAYEAVITDAYQVMRRTGAAAPAAAFYIEALAAKVEQNNEVPF